MIDNIRAFIAQKMPRREGGQTDTGPAAVQIAACALLLELAHADGEFGPEERQHIVGALDRHFGLDQSTASELIALAEAARAESIDQFQFTRIITANYDLGQKMVLAEVMWGVILADGRIAEHEAYFVRKLANLLDLKPGYLAQARRAAEPAR